MSSEIADMLAVYKAGMKVIDEMESPEKLFFEEPFQDLARLLSAAGAFAEKKSSRPKRSV